VGNALSHDLEVGEQRSFVSHYTLTTDSIRIKIYFSTWKIPNVEPPLHESSIMPRHVLLCIRTRRHSLLLDNEGLQYNVCDHYYSCEV